jgi:CBS domain-containing protein
MKRETRRPKEIEMKVHAAMTSDVVLASPDLSLRDAAALMAQHDFGVLPVGENDRLVGMITDRDIAVRGVAEGLGPDAKVSEVMSREVKYCFEDDDVDDVADNMGRIQVRRLPVLERDSKRLVGILSMGNVAQCEDARTSGKALAGVSTPGGAHSQTAH